MADESTSTVVDQAIVANAIQISSEPWVTSRWRPYMGFLYMAINAFDFIIFPLISMFLPVFTSLPYAKWESLTLTNGGLIHMAFGAILGVAAWSRGQEKLANMTR